MSVNDKTLLQLIIADFSSGVEVSSSWQNAIGSTELVHEARRRPTDRPFRALRYSMSSVSRQQFDVRTVLDLARMAGEGRLDAPLWPDVCRLTATAASGGTALTVDDADYRRLHAGSRALLVWFDDWAGADSAYGSSSPRTRARASRVETVTVASASGTSVVIEAPGVQTAAGFPTGSRLYPLIRCEAQFDVSADMLTRSTVTMVMDAIEAVDGATLPAAHAVGATPSWCGEYKSLPVLTLRDAVGSVVNAARGSAVEGVLQVLGLSAVPSVYGDSAMRARDVLSYEFSTKTRADFWKFLEFFDSRAGRVHPWWLAVPEHSWPIDAISGGGVILEGDTEFIADDDWQARYDAKHAAFMLRDGTAQYRGIVSALSGGAGRFRLLVDSPVSFSVGDIARCADLCLVRFSEDGIREEWSSPRTCKIRFSAVQLRTSSDGEDDPDPPPVDDGTTDAPPEDDWTADDVCDETSGVLAPMYGYPCGSCDGDRPVVRVADLELPIEIDLAFYSAYFAEDTTRIGSQTLTALKKALNGKKKLAYASHTFSPGTSRHWHHLRATGTPPSNAWTHAVPSVSRELWQTTRTYLGDDGTTEYELDVRLVVEWDAAPVGSEEGAWGALIHIYAFSTEVNPTYVDGVAWTDGITYWKDDPCVSGSAASGSADEKHCHPQMVLCACIPTSFQAPCDPQKAPTEYELCIAVPNGAPWSADDLDYAKAVCVFGSVTGGWNLAAMTVGGGTPVSDLTEYVCVENGAASGLTALSCSKCGWDEAEGTLTATVGSAVTISACLPAQPDENSCHPKPSDQPETTAGGSIECWHSGTAPTDIGEVCISASADLLLTVKQRCRCTKDTYDGSCAVTEEDLYVCGYKTRTLRLEPLTCDYNFGADQTNRSFYWRMLDTDPDRVQASYEDEFNDGLSDGWSTRRGTWQELGGALELVTPAGSGDLRGLYQRNAEAESGAVLDFTAEFTVEDASVDGYGFAYRGSTSGSAYTGYYAECNPVAGTLRICYYAAGAETELGTASGITVSDGSRVRVSASGTSHSIEVVGSSSSALSVEDCTVIPGGGYAGPASTDGTGGQRYDRCELVDNTTDPIEVNASLTSSGWSVSISEKSMPGYRQKWCEDDPAQAEQCDGCDGAGDVDLCKETEPTALDATTGDCDLVGPGDPKDSCFTSCDLWDGFVALTARLSASCNDDDVSHNAESQSAGFDVWVVECAVI